MTAKFFPEALYEAGYAGLVSVIPPGAQLTPSSKIVPAQVGKVPGRRLANGLWAGYDWRKHEPTIDDVRAWCVAGANVGLRADRFPAVDIDCKDTQLAQVIEDVAVAELGFAPVRVGRAPKRLLMYRLAAGAPEFGRMRLWAEVRGERHLVEILGQGQQYVVSGTHPGTMRPYTWNVDLASFRVDQLPEITREAADAFITKLAATLQRLGVVTEREGDGKPLAARAADQVGLRAPSVEVLREAVSAIPNSSALFPSRSDYLTMGYAIRAAAGEDNAEDAYGIFADWAARWDDGVNDVDVVRADWRRMKGPYSVGWSWVAEQARAFGFNDAALEFEAVESAPTEVDDRAPAHSDQWLAERIVERQRGVLRYVPQRAAWLVWDGARWQHDAELLAEDVIKRELRSIAADVMRQGATVAEKKESLKLATAICSAGKATAVAAFVRSDRAVAVSMESLDHDPWVLNTPSGLVNLRDGVLHPADPDALCTKVTAVPPDFAGACPEFRRFLAEATGGDAQLEAYLQKLAGYALTGSTREQQLTFIYGSGGNGKSVFLNVLTGVLGDYARTATMDTFTASYGEKHSTDVAMLVGARLVTASETSQGKRWDEARVKLLTGGEPVTARFMRADNFTFVPQFKLIFVGNHRPETRDTDEGMRRRVQIVPFDIKPAVVDRELPRKLREEWPAILAWMVEGCLRWQQEGLTPPASVLDSTEEYFAEEDATGRWLAECVTTAAPGDGVTTAELFDSWSEWANRNGEFRGSIKRFAGSLVARKLSRWRHPDSRRNGFAGIQLVNRQDVGIFG